VARISPRTGAIDVKPLHILSLAALLTTGAAAATFAASSGSTDTQEMTGTPTDSQQVGRPATDDTITTRQGQVLHETHISDRE
jgi:hypothetical protein